MTNLSGTLPWTKSCFVCGEDNPHGLHLRSRVEDGIVVLDYHTAERDLGWRHIVHGGIAMTLLDEVMTWAAILAFRSPSVAAEVSVRLKKPITLGMQLSARSEIPAEPRRLVAAEGQLLGDGEVVASATGRYLPMPAEGLKICSEDFVTGPDSIPLDVIFG